MSIMYGCFVMDILWETIGVEAPIHELLGTPTNGAGVPLVEAIMLGAIWRMVLYLADTEAA